MISLMKFADERHIKGKEEYGMSYLDKSKEDLIQDIREELADVLNYLSYLEEVHKVDIYESVKDVIKIDTQIMQSASK